MSAFEMSAFEVVTPSALPAPFRGLLDHTASMTATLAAPHTTEEDGRR